MANYGPLAQLSKLADTGKRWRKRLFSEPEHTLKQRLDQYGEDLQNDPLSVVGASRIPGVANLVGMVKSSPLREALLEATSRPEFKYAQDRLINNYAPHKGELGQLMLPSKGERGVLLTPNNVFKSTGEDTLEYAPAELKILRNSKNTVNLHTHPIRGQDSFSGSDVSFYRNTQLPDTHHVTGVVAPDGYMLVRNRVDDWDTDPQELVSRYGGKPMEWEPGVNDQSFENWMNNDVRYAEQAEMIRKALNSKELDAWVDFPPPTKDRVRQLLQQYRN